MAVTKGMNKLLALFAVFLFLLTGCSRNAPPSSGNATPSPPSVAGAPLPAGRALVVTMNVGVTVDDVSAARESIRASVTHSGGYVADASTSAGSAQLELKVPAKDASSVRAALGRLGDVTSDIEKVQDVTEERADLDARLANARASEKRVQEIMATKTGSVGDVLDAERELSRIRESIERLDAQKRGLDGKVDFATVNVSLSARPEPAAWKTPGQSIVSAAKGGATAAKAAVIYGLIALAAAAPFLVPMALLITVVVVMARRRRAIA